MPRPRPAGQVGGTPLEWKRSGEEAGSRAEDDTSLEKKRQGRFAFTTLTMSARYAPQVWVGTKRDDWGENRRSRGRDEARGQVVVTTSRCCVSGRVG